MLIKVGVSLVCLGSTLPWCILAPYLYNLAHTDADGDGTDDDDNDDDDDDNNNDDDDEKLQQR